MPRGTEKPQGWTRERHTKARAKALHTLHSEDVWESASLLAVDLSHALDEIERLSTEVAYLWTAGGITPNPALELAYGVWEAKCCVAEGTRL